MQFDLSEYDAFRAEIRAWCESRWPGGFAARKDVIAAQEGDWTVHFREAQRALGEKGWLCGAWPEAYGGGNWTKVKQAVFNEEAAYRSVPGTGIANIGVSTIGPTIMHFGSETQKARYLPPLAQGEVVWSQGFSEPNAGSDLASLVTRAERQGDRFVLNGAKIWGHAAYTDYMLVLARTDPSVTKHKGITQFIVPIKDTPGLTIQPIRDSMHYKRWTLVTFEDVILDFDAVIGTVNNGWYQAVTSLDFERSQIAWVGEARRTLEEVIRYARYATLSGTSALDDPHVRDQLGALATELETARWMSYRVAYLQDQGQIPNVEASMSKVFATEVHQRIYRFGASLSAPAALLKEGTEWSVDDGLVVDDYWGAAGTTLAGGTSEVQRNIIATRGLGLPR